MTRLSRLACDLEAAYHLLLASATLRLHLLRRSRWKPGLPDPLLIVQGAAAFRVLPLEPGHEVADVAVGIQRLIAADIDPEHGRTLAAIFGDILTLTPESQEWFEWLASIPSFAFIGREGRFTARCETKQRGQRYWIAYQRIEGRLLKRYLGKTSDLTATKLEDNAGSISSARPAPPTCIDAPATLPPVLTIAPYVFPEQVMAVDIGQAPKGPPYDDTSWLPDRSHFPLVPPTKERCPIHPSACWLQRDPTGQAWCTHPTCWRRYSLMRLAALIDYHRMLGYSRDTFIATGAESWAAYANEKDDTHIEFSLRQTIFYCTNLGLQLPDLSEDARLHAVTYDAWK